MALTTFTTRRLLFILSPSSRTIICAAKSSIMQPFLVRFFEHCRREKVGISESSHRAILPSRRERSDRPVLQGRVGCCRSAVNVPSTDSRFRLRMHKSSGFRSEASCKLFPIDSLNHSMRSIPLNQRRPTVRFRIGALYQLGSQVNCRLPY